MHHILHFAGLLTGAVIAVLLTAYALFALPPEEPVDSRPRVWQLLLLWTVIFMSLWPCAYAVAEIGGWIFVWGDNNHIGQDYVVHFACAVSGAIATAAVARLALGWAGTDYAGTLLWLAAGLLAIEAIFILTQPDILPTLLTFSPILIAAACWLGVYRRQVQERRLSLGSIFALMSVLAIGLAATAYIRS